jgi:hypothetical protein
VPPAQKSQRDSVADKQPPARKKSKLDTIVDSIGDSDEGGCKSSCDLGYDWMMWYAKEHKLEGYEDL